MSSTGNMRSAHGLKTALVYSFLRRHNSSCTITVSCQTYAAYLSLVIFDLSFMALHEELHTMKKARPLYVHVRAHQPWVPAMEQGQKKKFYKVDANRFKRESCFVFVLSFTMFASSATE